MKQTTSKAVRKYLLSHAEPETRLLIDLPAIEPFDHVLVIPAYQESNQFFDRLAQALMRDHAVLLIVVINQPDALSEPDLQNTILCKHICDATSQVWQLGQLQLRLLPETSSAVLLVDRFSQSPIPHKQGVGLARKIGADLALSLIYRGLISQDWIYNSDADAHLPAGYFSALISARLKSAQHKSAQHKSAYKEQRAAVAVFPYRHICGSDKVGQATRLYEQRLRQYVDGLRAAGSPYAYHSLGSTLAINAASYAMVRGFPRRNGGEDFYLLNKAAKLGGVLSLNAPQIQIDARQSNRVPFGTGPAIGRLLSEDSLDEAGIFYHPEVFRHLAQWLEFMPRTRSSSLSDLPISAPARQALAKLNIEKAISSAKHTSRTQEIYAQHMHTWFDGFRTLRFIHLLRDTVLPEQDLRDVSARELARLDKPDP